VSLFPVFDHSDNPVLELCKLSAGYDGVPVSCDLELTLSGGQVLALVGGNGSGKTTLLKTIAGLVPPVSGSILIRGKSPREASRSIAWLGQFHPSNPMLPLRVRDVVRMARYPERGLLQRLRSEDEDTVDEALDYVGMQKARNKTLGLLSGGQRQRVFLAYALARLAPLVLLDEPRQNLDERGDQLVADATEHWRKAGTAVVTATHDPTEAAHADQVLRFGVQAPAH